MNLKILETSLNLRIETKLGKTIKDYKQCEEVGKIQYEQCADIIANVEDMNCDATDYKRYLKEYNAIEALEDYQERGVSCYVKNTLAVEKSHKITWYCYEYLSLYLKSSIIIIIFKPKKS